MNQSDIEAQARYLIQDRIHLAERTRSVRNHRRRHRLRRLSWL
jgi:hypothetical protein